MRGRRPDLRTRAPSAHTHLGPRAPVVLDAAGRDQGADPRPRPPPADTADHRIPAAGGPQGLPSAPARLFSLGATGRSPCTSCSINRPRRPLRNQDHPHERVPGPATTTPAWFPDSRTGAAPRSSSRPTRTSPDCVPNRWSTLGTAFRWSSGWCMLAACCSPDLSLVAVPPGHAGLVLSGSCDRRCS